MLHDRHFSPPVALHGIFPRRRPDADVGLSPRAVRADHSAPVDERASWRAQSAVVAGESIGNGACLSPVVLVPMPSLDLWISRPLARLLVDDGIVIRDFTPTQKVLWTSAALC